MSLGERKNDGKRIEKNEKEKIERIERDTRTDNED